MRVGGSSAKACADVTANRRMAQGCHCERAVICARDESLIDGSSTRPSNGCFLPVAPCWQCLCERAT